MNDAISTDYALHRRSHDKYYSGPPETSTGEEDELELPVNPDESNPIIPDDDERILNVPS